MPSVIVPEMRDFMHPSNFLVGGGGFFSPPPRRARVIVLLFRGGPKSVSAWLTVRGYSLWWEYQALLPFFFAAAIDDYHRLTFCLSTTAVWVGIFDVWE